MTDAELMTGVQWWRDALGLQEWNLLVDVKPGCETLASPATGEACRGFIAEQTAEQTVKTSWGKQAVPHRRVLNQATITLAGDQGDEEMQRTVRHELLHLGLFDFKFLASRLPEEERAKQRQAAEAAVQGLEAAFDRAGAQLWPATEPDETDLLLGEFAAEQGIEPATEATGSV